MENRVLRIHDVAGDYPALVNVDGIDTYWDRSLLLGGVCLAHGEPDADFAQLLADYREWGWKGRLHWVPNRSGDFYADVLADRGTRSLIRALVGGNGHALEIFRPTPRGAQFVRALGLDWHSHTSDPTVEVAQIWNDKAELRHRLEAAGFGSLLPANHVVTSVEALRRWLDHYSSNGADGVMLKLTDRASSEGMVTLAKHGDPQPFIDRYWSEGERVIVEAAHDHWPISGVLTLTEQGVTPDYGSLQIMQGIPIGQRLTVRHMIEQGVPAHRGNVVGSPGMSLGPIMAEVVTTFLASANEAAQPIWDSGYRGRLCFDGIHLTPAVTYIVEANARKSNSMYADGYRRAVEPQFPGGKCVVVMANVFPTGIAGYRQARSMLGDRRYRGNGRAGVSLFHARCLQHGKAGLLAAGRCYQEAVDTFLEAEAALLAG